MADEIRGRRTAPLMVWVDEDGRVFETLDELKGAHREGAGDEDPASTPTPPPRSQP